MKRKIQTHDWFSLAMDEVSFRKNEKAKFLMEMEQQTRLEREEAKRQRLIAYIIGVVIGMAIGSLVVRAIYG